MKIFVFRHNKFEASWSQINEPSVYSDSYLFAEIIVLAKNLQEAYDFISKEHGWDVEELKRLNHREIDTDESCIVSQYVTGG